jgi:hypothetical protein
VVIDQEFDVDSFTGFLPCKFKGSLSGFEYFSARISVEDAVELEVSESDFSITLVVHSGHNELPTAACVASALCVASGGLLVDPQSGDTFLSSNVVPWVKSVIAEYLEDPL